MSDLPTRRARTLTGHTGPVLRVRYTSDGAYAMTCGADRTLRLWNPSRDDETGRNNGALCVATYQGPHAREVSDVAVADDKARFVSCGGDRTAFVWDVATGQVRASRTVPRVFNGNRVHFAPSSDGPPPEAS